MTATDSREYVVLSLAHWIILGLMPVSLSPISSSYHQEIEISSLIELHNSLFVLYNYPK
ncbi:hypothetical protein MICAK_1750023 [Microcystis aeruginosa PCC 9701]|uniref:Uncharacterized protein n=1 Tax=Microcystis aeruginosa PCC 9701 TaxID=721123 RepID=I4IMR4_MICAE|nr:hypothetical protein MICAK_1750023 [Microcystis aeruginosa PCC 9701]